MDTQPESLERISEALRASGYSYTSGATHNFYHYPARFSPDIARATMEVFSNPDDIVLDPFMGGGTSIIEGLMMGRQMVGVDLNALATFVTDVRTTPLSQRDQDFIRAWATVSSINLQRGPVEGANRSKVRNLPKAVETFVAGSLQLSDQLLETPRQRAFARCALLRLGQWALDCRDFVAPRRRRLAARLPRLVEDLLAGLEEFTNRCRLTGLSKNEITGRRALLHRSAVGLEAAYRNLGWKRPRLVLTSPPYPGVHVLYHRWQYRGRKETAAPYWIARVPDGFYESYYTGGSRRTPTGQRRYFEMIEAAFASVRKILAPDGIVAQLIGFSDARAELPLYLEAMRRAGFVECRSSGDERLDRRVPNRKWYAKLQGAVDASSELLLLHRPTD